MKNINEVLALKLAEYDRVKAEIEALRLAARLLSEDVPTASVPEPAPLLPRMMEQIPKVVSALAPAPVSKPGMYSAAWENESRKLI